MQLEQLLATLRKLTGQNESGDADSVLVSLIALLSLKDDATAALKTTADHPDPAKFVPVAVMKLLGTQTGEKVLPAVLNWTAMAIFSGEQTLGACCAFQELECIFNSIDTPNAWTKGITEYEHITVFDSYVCISG
ncbi:hypothetical protein SAMN05421863_107821 [Nitrosomonas communis]|uniref:Uncharacterized protein n=1 Tax=Nitrosomonas communis TaxID=44574 RepID=A0A1I4VAG4_9PROT|nr:hypothetical protein SAMN05421863_107821 [Nitrosomonas communis]